MRVHPPIAVSESFTEPVSVSLTKSISVFVSLAQSVAIGLTKSFAIAEPINIPQPVAQSVSESVAEPVTEPVAQPVGEAFTLTVAVAWPDTTRRRANAGVNTAAGGKPVAGHRRRG